MRASGGTFGPRREQCGQGWLLQGKTAVGQRRECRSEGWGLWPELQCLAGTCPAGTERRRGTLLRMSVMSLPGERRWRQLLNRNRWVSCSDKIRAVRARPGRVGALQQGLSRRPCPHRACAWGASVLTAGLRAPAQPAAGGWASPSPSHLQPVLPGLWVWLEAAGGHL